MTGIALLLCLLGGVESPQDALEISIALPETPLEVGGKYEIRVEVTLREGWSSSDSGIPKPILQIKAPKAVELSGKRLTKQRDLARNEYLQAPFERLIDDGAARIGFKLRRAPKPDDVFAFNVLAYVSRKGGDDNGWFVRKRFELPLRAGASATSVAVEPSDWGANRELQLGDKAAMFSLPRADGRKVVLRKLLGKKNIVITTYRAFW